MFTRVALFVLTNILILTTVSVIASIFGIGSYITEAGLNYGNLMFFCLMWGFVGAFISLAISRWMAKRALGVKVLEAGKAGEYEWIVSMVHDLSKRSGLPAMPEVGIYDSDDVNAFATGPSKRKSLVAFSTGLLRTMSKQEVEGVAAHEVAHIQNGDMVTMTLLQGVINAFVMFFARIIAHVASQSVREELSTVVWYVSVFLFQFVFGMLGMVITCWFSRKREFKADAASARLAGRDKMIAALEALQKIQGREASDLPESIAAFGISGAPKKLFSTHPPLEVRIKALQSATL